MKKGKGRSPLDARYWMRKFENIEHTLTPAQKLSFLRPITICLIDSIKNSPAVAAQQKYNEKRAKQLLDSFVAKKRQATSVKTSVTPEPSTENSALPRENPPENPRRSDQSQV